MSKALLKSEWEVMQGQLKTEKGVLKALEKHYSEALKAVDTRIAEMLGRNDANLPHVIRRIEYQKMVKAQVQAALDSLHAREYETISEYLQDSYTDAFVGTMYTLHHQDMPVIVPIDQNAALKAVTIDSKVKSDLYTALGVDVNKLKKTITSEITRGVASGLLYDDITRNIANISNIPLKRAKTITRTEAGRVQEQAAFDAANKALAAGADVVKQWSAIRDGKTRDTHRALDGQVREVNEPFTVDGHKAMHPHGFGVAAEDVNCRCTMLTRARAALDEDELKLLQERAAAHGLLVKDKKGFEDAKAKDFSDFKKKYLKAAVKYEYNMAQASKIEVNGLFVNKTEKLYRYAKNIPPIDGYEDFTCHADPDSFYIDLVGEGRDEDFFKLTPEEYAVRIKNSTTYQGGNIRIISCQAGAKKDGAAQRLADALNVNVYAPTETVHVTEKGEIFVTDNEILAEIWYNEDDRSSIKQTGEWKVFKPRKE